MRAATVRLEPLDPARHGDALFEAGPTDAALLRYLPERPFPDRASFQPWLDKAAASEDPLFFAAIDTATGRAEGRLSLMRIDPAHGVIETGHILFGPAARRARRARPRRSIFSPATSSTISATAASSGSATTLNEPSKRAAIRFGFAFEGVFRQHMVVKGENRDTAWYAMIDSEWPAPPPRLRALARPGQFRRRGRQRLSLSALNAERLERRRRRAPRSPSAADLAAIRALQRAAYAPQPRNPRRRAAAAAVRLRDALGHYEAWVADGDGRSRRRADPRSAPGPPPDLEHRRRARGAEAQGSAAGFSSRRRRGPGRSACARCASSPARSSRENVRWYDRHGYAIERVEQLDDRRVVFMDKRI